MNPDYSYTHVEMGVKNLVHIMTGSPSDITLLMSALYQLIQKENEWHGDKYRFDSVVMRAFYYLNLPDEAIKVNICPFFIYGNGLNSRQSFSIIRYLMIQ